MSRNFDLKADQHSSMSEEERREVQGTSDKRVFIKSVSFFVNPDFSFVTERRSFMA